MKHPDSNRPVKCSDAITFLVVAICVLSPSYSNAQVAEPPLELSHNKQLLDVTGGAPRDRQFPRNELTLGDLGPELHTRRVYAALTKVKPDLPLATRGAREVNLYARHSPSVVLIVSNDSVGSGSLISADGIILTNWHVVRGTREVGVVFKPALEGRKLGPADMRRASVLRSDEVADLALLRVSSVPTHVKPIQLGTMAKVQVGADVHAIGHPTGEAWTYTRGIVSQIRKGYEWQTESRLKHRAEVIQTQTPINPGNSGGPLLSDVGELLGVNSFKAQGEALNFAVSVTEVRRFLTESGDRKAQASTPSAPRTCEPKVLKRGRNKENDADVAQIDVNCDGMWDWVYTEPDDPGKPIYLQIDSKDTGRIDIVIYDHNRDGKWDISYHDLNDDGKPDIVGYHPDGTIKPSRFEIYVASR